MIGAQPCFGRSNEIRCQVAAPDSPLSITTKDNCQPRRVDSGRVLIVLWIIALSLLSSDALAIFGGGMYPTRVKMEYQYSDYTSYRYPQPLIPVYPDTLYQTQDPHIADFPETRTLVRITQTVDPVTALQVRYQYSDLTEDKNQRLFYARLARDVTDMNAVYGAYQFLEQPGNYKGHMMQVGLRHDRSGWIIAETAFSYLRNVYDDGNEILTYAPMVLLRYSVDRYTAVMGRVEYFWSGGDNDDSQSFIYSLNLSRFFPTQTAVHIGLRYYDNDIGVQSYAPAIEIAQYVLWNLTLRASYRYYENSIGNEEIAATVEESSIRSHSGRVIVEWEAIADLKFHLKLRRYTNNQHIGMNTYLLGFEVML